MPKGKACAFCALPETVRAPLLAAWRGGASYARLGTLATDLGHPMPLSALQHCPTRSGHHERHTIADGATRERLGRIAELLERSGISPDDIGSVQSVRLSEWQGLTKNDETGAAEVTPLSGASIVLTPTWATGPAWQPVDRAPRPVPPVPTRRRSRTRRRTRTAVILPDVQIGFRRDLDTGALDPFHDEAAIAAALRVVSVADPDLVIHLGDLIDLASFGTYEIEAAFAATVQPAIDRAHAYLAQVATAAPRARQIVLEGNHDRRLQKSITKNALAAFGLRRANAPSEWPVLSIPYLLRTDELDITYSGGWPANIVWINDRLACIHGHKVRSSGSTAAAVLDDNVSVIFGHIHRQELQAKTTRLRSGARTSIAASPGCLCRVDGAVPSAKGSTDPLGRPVPTVENWQQGVAVVTYRDGDAPFHLELVAIDAGEVVFRGEYL